MKPRDTQVHIAIYLCIIFFFLFNCFLRSKGEPTFYMKNITINVLLFKKLRDIIFFVGQHFFDPFLTASAPTVAAVAPTVAAAAGPHSSSRGPFGIRRGPHGSRRGLHESRRGPHGSRRRPHDSQRGPHGSRHGPHGDRPGPNSFFFLPV